MLDAGRLAHTRHSSQAGPCGCKLFPCFTVRQTGPDPVRTTAVEACVTTTFPLERVVLVLETISGESEHCSGVLVTNGTLMSKSPGFNKLANLIFHAPPRLTELVVNRRIGRDCTHFCGIP